MGHQLRHLMELQRRGDEFLTFTEIECQHIRLRPQFCAKVEGTVFLTCCSECYSGTKVLAEYFLELRIEFLSKVMVSPFLDLLLRPGRGGGVRPLPVKTYDTAEDAVEAAIGVAVGRFVQ